MVGFKWVSWFELRTNYSWESDWDLIVAPTTNSISSNNEVWLILRLRQGNNQLHHSIFLPYEVCLILKPSEAGSLSDTFRHFVTDSQWTHIKGPFSLVNVNKKHQTKYDNHLSTSFAAKSPFKSSHQTNAPQWLRDIFKSDAISST